MQHDFYQAILDGKLSNKDSGDTTPAKTGPGKFSGNPSCHFVIMAELQHLLGF